MVRLRGDGWTDDMLEQLRRHHEAGKTAAETAELMGGGLTRNAVLAKWNRLGLSKKLVGMAGFARLDDLVADHGLTVKAAAKQSGVPIARAEEHWAALVARYDMGLPRTARDDVAYPVKAAA